MHVCDVYAVVVCSASTTPGSYIAYVPELGMTGCNATGATPCEAMEKLNLISASVLQVLQEGHTRAAKKDIPYVSKH